ncbi:hypothetical protein EVAR_59202_1 [Eumeta japonica]|uniref:Uncharacterized protein n=1 Tax=Eumeta variegata TaxID=151549 RepID=A0A4C1ZJY4_EUMVA|nr:hypothetical protein EVAR_59202_1 [Eumeta japonica]
MQTTPVARTRLPPGAPSTARPTSKFPDGAANEVADKSNLKALRSRNKYRYIGESRVVTFKDEDIWIHPDRRVVKLKTTRSVTRGGRPRKPSSHQRQLSLPDFTSHRVSRGFGGWRSPSASWGAPWRVLGPSLRTAVPLSLLWTAAVAAHTAMVAFCIRSLLNLGCGSPTCVGVAGAQLAVSATTLASAGYMVRLDLVYDAARSPPPRCPDGQTCTGVSMVPLTSVALGGDAQADCGGSPPKNHKQKELKEEEAAVLEKSDVQT